MLTLSTSSSLNKITFFKNLTPQQLTWLEAHLYCQTYPAGSHILLAEQPGDLIYIILDGTIKVYVQQTDGSEVILAILGPGDPVGELSLLDSLGRSASVVTLEKSTLLWMDRNTFCHCLETMPALAQKLVQVVCSRLRLANEQIRALATLDVESRVARQLLAIAEQYGRTADNGDVRIPIRLTQGDLADCIGASRERVNQVMVAYKEHCYLSVSQDYRITLHNKEALIKRCS